MSISHVWSCDGGGCTHAETLDDTCTPVSLGEFNLKLGHVEIWRGHLCQVCRTKLEANLRNTMSTWL